MFSQTFSAGVTGTLSFASQCAKTIGQMITRHVLKRRAAHDYGPNDRSDKLFYRPL